MNTKFLITPLVAATLFVAIPLRAQPSPQNAAGILTPAVQHPLSEQDKDLIKRFDKNGDGVLDDEELAQAHESMYHSQTYAEILARRIYDQMLEKFDTQHEGKLDSAQQDQALEYLKTDHPTAYKKAIARFGRAGSDSFNAGEKNAFFQYLSNLPSTLSKKEIPAQKLYVALLKKFDTENKGVLTPDQQAKAVEFLQTNRPQVYDSILKKYDMNGDGKLDKEETAHLFSNLEKLAPPQEAKAAGL